VLLSLSPLEPVLIFPEPVLVFPEPVLIFPKPVLVYSRTGSGEDVPEPVLSHVQNRFCFIPEPVLEKMYQNRFWKNPEPVLVITRTGSGSFQNRFCLLRTGSGSTETGSRW
jgi:hypothetical protein